MTSIIKNKIWNAIEIGISIIIAQELQSKKTNFRRWCAIYALYKLDFSEKKSNLHKSFLFNLRDFDYCIFTFDMQLSLIESDDGYDESDIEITYCEGAKDLHHIHELLERNKINAEDFTMPWHCDFPLVINCNAVK